MVPQPWNLFADVRVDENGCITDRSAVSSPADQVQIRAEMDLVLVLVAGPLEQHPALAELETEHACSAIEYSILGPRDKWDGMQQFVSPVKKMVADSASKACPGTPERAACYRPQVHLSHKPQSLPH